VELDSLDLQVSLVLVVCQVLAVHSAAKAECLEPLADQALAVNLGILVCLAHQDKLVIVDIAV